MKWILGIAMLTALSASAEDKHKEKVKSETTDPVTGDKVKHKSSTKVESDGDYKTKSRTKVNGSTVAKEKVEHEADGDHKEEVEIKGSNGKYKSKTKVDK